MINYTFYTFIQYQYIHIFARFVLALENTRLAAKNRNRPENRVPVLIRIIHHKTKVVRAFIETYLDAPTIRHKAHIMRLIVHIKCPHIV